MRLKLVLQPSDGLAKSLEFFERRRYVARRLVPDGYEEYFRERARFVSAHTSTAIEGNPLDERQAFQMLLRGIASDDPNEIEIANVERAYAVVAELAADPSLRIDQGLIRSLNSLVLRDLEDPAARQRGRYRRGPASVIDAATRAVRYDAPPPEWVPSLMEGFEEDLATWMDADNPLVTAAKAHFAIVSIHPFADGNGRTARLIADLILERTGWSADGMLSSSSALLSLRREYYDALRETQGPEFIERVDLQPFVTFHTEALTHAVAVLEDRAIEFSRRNDEIVQDASGILSRRQVIGLMYMRDVGPVSSSMYARLNKRSQSAAVSDLGRIVEFGLAVRQGRGKSTRYAIHPRFAAG